MPAQTIMAYRHIGVPLMMRGWFAEHQRSYPERDLKGLNNAAFSRSRFCGSWLSGVTAQHSPTVAPSKNARAKDKSSAPLSHKMPAQTIMPYRHISVPSMM